MKEFYLDYYVDNRWVRLIDRTGSNLVFSNEDECRGAKLVIENIYNYQVRFTEATVVA
jgi:hypothetical protein